jgi:hypothetical protein
MFSMSNTKLRGEIKKAVDRVSPDRLSSLADYVSFLTRPSVPERLATAEKAIKAGKGTNWRKVRSDV